MRPRSRIDCHDLRRAVDLDLVQVVTQFGELAVDEPAQREEEILARRDLVWEALLPRTWSLVLRDVPCERYVALRQRMISMEDELYNIKEKLLEEEMGAADEDDFEAEPVVDAVEDLALLEALQGGLAKLLALLLQQGPHVRFDGWPGVDDRHVATPDGFDWVGARRGRARDAGHQRRAIK